MTKRTARTAQLHVGSVRAEVTYKDIKSLRLRVVPPDGAVKVSVPHGVPHRKVVQFLQAHEQWVAVNREQVIRANPQPEPSLSGGRARLWGHWYELRLEQAARANASVVGSTLVLSGPDEAAQGRGLENLYRRELRAAVVPLFAHYEPLVGREHESLRLRRMTSLWGSCNNRTGAITLNTALAERPPQALEYVVLHELAHLIERGHGPPFQAIMDALMPDWRARRKALRWAA